MTTAELSARFETVGVYNMVPAPKGALEGQQPIRVPLKFSLTSASPKAQRVRATLSTADLWDKPGGWRQQLTVDLPAGATLQREVILEAGPGYHQILGQFESEQANISAWTDIGIIPPTHPGLRPDSFFASNTSHLRLGDELRLLQVLGMKVQRSHLPLFLLADPLKVATGAPLPIDVEATGQHLEPSKAAGIWVLPIVGYALEGARSPLSEAMKMHGPPRNFEEFVATWELIVKRYPEITTYEFWNEPWIFGWTWAATPDEYRQLQTMFFRMALKHNPKMRLIAGNSSMFTEDHIEAYPDCWKGMMAGTSHHPYTGCHDDNVRSGAQGRSTDHGYQVTQHMGLPYYYLTEGGTWYSQTSYPPEIQEARKRKDNAQVQLRDLGEPDDNVAKLRRQEDDLAAALRAGKVPATERSTAELRLAELGDLRKQAEADAPAARQRVATMKKTIAEAKELIASVPSPYNHPVNAYKAIHYMVRAALAGVFQGNMQWEIGYGPGWTRSNTAFALLTHLTEDRPVVADIWPEHEMIWGAIFAHPRHVTDAVRALPRAKDMCVRWQVPVPPERANDHTKVAVIWSQTGLSNRQIDAAGTLTIDDARGLKAYDLVGHEIPPVDGKLTVPFNQYPRLHHHRRIGRHPVPPAHRQCDHSQCDASEPLRPVADASGRPEAGPARAHGKPAQPHARRQADTPDRPEPGLLRAIQHSRRQPGGGARRLAGRGIIGTERIPRHAHRRYRRRHS